VIVPAESTAVLTTPQLPKQRSMLSMLTGGGSSMTPAQKKTSQEHAAKAEAVDMAPGFALYNASLPEKSKKRKRGYTIEEVARKDNDVSDHQDCRDAEEFVKHMFTTTKDNPQRGYAAQCTTRSPHSPQTPGGGGMWRVRGWVSVVRGWHGADGGAGTRNSPCPNSVRLGVP